MVILLQVLNFDFCNFNATQLKNKGIILMKYGVTPINILCAFLIGLEILFFTFPQILKNEHYGYQHIYLLPLALIGFLVDYFLQKIFKKYFWIIFTETIIIVATVLLNISY